MLEQILGEADSLVRRRLEEAGLDAPHLLVAVTPDSEVILRSNVGMDGMKALGEDLQKLADEIDAPATADGTAH